MNKRRAFIVVTAMTLLAVFCLFLGAAAPVPLTKTIFETPLYSDASFDSEPVLASIKANETVEITGDVIRDVNNVEWVSVTYNSVYSGYLPYRYLYVKHGEEEYNFAVMKATGRSTDAEIKIYAYFDENSTVVAVLHDGEKINVVLEDKDYGEFVKVVYDGAYCFVKAENVTDGLTYNQKLATIIASSLIGGILIAAFAFTIIYNLKKQGRFNHKKLA